jgi:hypothetical protein
MTPEQITELKERIAYLEAIIRSRQMQYPPYQAPYPIPKKDD